MLTKLTTVWVKEKIKYLLTKLTIMTNVQNVPNHIRLTTSEKESISKCLYGAETASGFVHLAIKNLIRSRKRKCVTK